MWRYVCLCRRWSLTRHFVNNSQNNYFWPWMQIKKKIHFKVVNLEWYYVWRPLKVMRSMTSKGRWNLLPKIHSDWLSKVGELLFYIFWKFKGHYHEDFAAFLVKTVLKQLWLSTFAHTRNAPRTSRGRYKWIVEGRAIKTIIFRTWKLKSCPTFSNWDQKLLHG